MDLSEQCGYSVEAQVSYLCFIMNPIADMCSVNCSTP
jgi:hypothetical protein